VLFLRHALVLSYDAADASQTFEQTAPSSFSSPLSSGLVSFIRHSFSTAISFSRSVLSRAAVCL
jgi:hypothetical protein